MAAIGSSNIFGRVCDSAGKPLTGDIIVDSVAPGTSDGIDMAAAGPAGFAVVWGDESLYGGTYARIVLADGSMPQGTVTIAGNVPPASSLMPSIASFSTGELFIVWLAGDGIHAGSTILGRLFDASLSPLGLPFRISQLWVPLGGPGIGIQGSRALVAWGRDVGGDWDPYARRVDLPGGPTGHEYRSHDTHTTCQGDPRHAFDATGRGLVIWSSYGQDGGSGGVFGRRLDPQGNPVGTEFQVNMTTFNPQIPDAIAMFPNGDFALAFSSGTDYTLDADVLMRRFFFPVSLALGPGPDRGNPPLIRWARPDGSAAPPPLVPYGAAGYGATVGSGDLDGDGFSEVLTGPGPSPAYCPQLRAFHRDNSSIQKPNF